MKNKLISFLLIGLFLNGILSAEVKQNTPVIRAAIDIGMGGPKLQIAEVDLESNKIVKMLHTQRYYVNFYEGSKNGEKRLSSDVMLQGLEAFKNAIEIAHSFNVNGIVSIATAALRSTSNGIEFAHRIQEETGIKIHIVDQNLEGRLTFQAVLSKMDIDAENLIVWDIGGGSVQFTRIATDGTFLVDCGDQGVGSFRDHIVGTIQGHNEKERQSPNPLSASDIAQAEIEAHNRSQYVDQVFKEKINNSDTKIVGAGSVFGCGIASMVGGKNPFCLEDIAAVAYDLEGKTDADFGGGTYAFCEGSNTLFVYGFMRGLGIKQVHIINVNNADGALTYEPFWK